MANLYEIDERLKVLEELNVDSFTGEVIEDDNEIKRLYNEIQMDLNTKLENTACYIKSLIADVEAIKNEENKLKTRRKAKENLAERLQNYLNNYIENSYRDEEGNVNLTKLNKFRFETPKALISYRKSESVNVTDLESLPNEYIKTETITKADKAEIKKAIKNGLEINGAELVTNYNMQIK